MEHRDEELASAERQVEPSSAGRRHRAMTVPAPFELVLELVGRLADDWGWSSVPGGKDVWTEMRFADPFAR